MAHLESPKPSSAVIFIICSMRLLMSVSPSLPDPPTASSSDSLSTSTPTPTRPDPSAGAVPWSVPPISDDDGA